jgi:hypothetical protein
MKVTLVTAVQPLKHYERCVSKTKITGYVISCCNKVLKRNITDSLLFNVQREQMLEAQEMFRTANKVTRPEKALILGFMAGSRGEYALYHILT